MSSQVDRRHVGRAGSPSRIDTFSPLTGFISYVQMTFNSGETAIIGFVHKRDLWT